MEGMPGITLILDIDENEEHRLKAEDEIIHKTTPFVLGTMKAGMSSGKTSIMLIFELPDGKKLVQETSLALLKMAVDGIRHLDEPGDQN